MIISITINQISFRVHADRYIGRVMKVLTEKYRCDSVGIFHNGRQLSANKTFFEENIICGDRLTADIYDHVRK